MFTVPGLHLPSVGTDSMFVFLGPRGGCGAALVLNSWGAGGGTGEPSLQSRRDDGHKT